MGNVNAKDPDYWNVTDDPGIRHTNWMSRLPDTKLVSDISIPGTHNTMAREDKGNIWVSCQSLSLNTQLQIGIRFFDIRCRHYYNDLPIHHGTHYQNCSFTDCMNEMTSFVRSNPSEFLLVRVKEEYEAAGCTKTFRETVWATLKNYREILWEKLEDSKSIPTIKEVRGKIIILREFGSDGSAIGIPYSTLDIEDNYRESTDGNKWGKVEAHLNKAEHHKDTRLYLTFNSCCILADAPRESARRLNTKLQGYVRSNRGPFGIIAIDYPGPKLIEDIIENNN